MGVRVVRILALVCQLFGASALAANYYDAYPISVETDRLDLGVQPMAYPLAFLSSVMLRDQTLNAELNRLKISLRVHPFRKGNDMVALAGKDKLEAAFLGDMPTINTLVRTPLAVVGLGKRNFSSVIARKVSRMEQLRGKRIGYSAGSSSHYVLMQGLQQSRLQAGDAVLVPMEPGAMPEALASGKVDAFVAWEPTPSIVLAQQADSRAIYRGMSTDWFVMTQAFAERQPEAALALVAAYARAIVWMRQGAANVRQAANWVLADGAAFLGEAPKVTLEQAERIVRKDLLDVAGAPAMPRLMDGAPPLSREFGFLKAQGLLPAEARETQLQKAFAYTGLRQVLADPTRFKLYQYDYAD